MKILCLIDNPPSHMGITLAFPIIDSIASDEGCHHPFSQNRLVLVQENLVLGR